MLPLEQVQQVKRLLDEGALSQRAIARRVGVSRGTVRAIAIGRRGLHGKETPLNPQAPAPREPKRCPSCGALVYTPCVYCRALDYGRRRRNGRRAAASPIDAREATRLGRVA